jgi:hypothetical protein
MVSLPVSLSWHWALPVSKDTILAKGFIFGFSGKFSHKFVVVKMQPKKSKVRQNEGKSKLHFAVSTPTADGNLHEV